MGRKTAPSLILLRTFSHTCGVKTSDSLSRRCGPQTAQSTTLSGVPFRRRFTADDDSLQSNSSSVQSSRSGIRSQGFINRAIDEWRRRLESVVQQQGWHIEHCFWMVQDETGYFAWFTVFSSLFIASIAANYFGAIRETCIKTGHVIFTR